MASQFGSTHRWDHPQKKIRLLNGFRVLVEVFVHYGRMRVAGKVLIRMKITLMASHVLVFALTLGAQAQDDNFNIDVKQKNAEVYHEQSSKNNEFNYGYQVEKENSQFQHKVKGPDDVTYGCYGYIDPNNEKHLVYYVADRLGYRLVPPNQPTKIFTERVASSINKLNKDLKDKKLDEKVVAWNDLYLPDSCRRLDEILTITTPPTNSSKTGSLVSLNQRAGNERPVPTSLITEKPYFSTRPTQPYRKVSSPTESVTLNSISLTTRSNEFLTTKSALVELTKENKAKQATEHQTTPQPIFRVTTDFHEEEQSVGFESMDGSTANPLGPGDGYSYPVPKNRLPECQQPNSPFLGQYNGYVYPIRTECSTSQSNVNQLMIQMEALNQQVLELTANIRALQHANLTSPASKDSDCRLWLDRQQNPLLIYVPILLPYLGGDFDSGRGQPSFKNPASYAYQKMCEDCINK